MVYLKHTTERQPIRIPATGIQAPGSAVLELYSGIDAQILDTFPVEILSRPARYVEGVVSLPDGIAVGEYGFRLFQDEKVVAVGVAVIGEFTRIADPGTGVSRITFTQYGENN